MVRYWISIAVFKELYYRNKTYFVCKIGNDIIPNINFASNYNWKLALRDGTIDF